MLSHSPSYTSNCNYNQQHEVIYTPMKCLLGNLGKWDGNTDSPHYSVEVLIQLCHHCPIKENTHRHGMYSLMIQDSLKT